MSRLSRADFSVDFFSICLIQLSSLFRSNFWVELTPALCVTQYTYIIYTHVHVYIIHIHMYSFSILRIRRHNEGLFCRLVGALLRIGGLFCGLLNVGYIPQLSTALWHQAQCNIHRTHTQTSTHPHQKPATLHTHSPCDVWCSGTLTAYTCAIASLQHTATHCHALQHTCDI